MGILSRVPTSKLTRLGDGGVASGGVGGGGGGGPVGANYGPVIRSVQATTQHRLDNDVLTTRVFESYTDNVQNFPVIPVVIDFPTATLTNLSLEMENLTSKSLDTTVWQGPSFGSLQIIPGGDGGGTWAPGQKKTVSLRFATYFGGDGDYILHFRSYDGTIPAGSIKMTLTGADVVAPGPI